MSGVFKGEPTGPEPTPQPALSLGPEAPGCCPPTLITPGPRTGNHTHRPCAPEPANGPNWPILRLPARPPPPREKHHRAQSSSSPRGSLWPDDALRPVSTASHLAEGTVSGTRASAHSTARAATTGKRRSERRRAKKDDLLKPAFPQEDNTSQSRRRPHVCTGDTHADDTCAASRGENCPICNPVFQGPPGASLSVAS